MRFQIPQFIDVEDRIFGPLTLKQFIYLAGGASVALVATTFLGVFMGLLVSSPIILLAAALAFYRINNRPFIHTLESAFKYITKDKLYVWKRVEKEGSNQPAQGESGGKFSALVVPNLSKSKLRDMNWELDVKKKESELLSKSQERQL